MIVLTYPYGIKEVPVMQEEFTTEISRGNISYDYNTLTSKMSYLDPG